MPAAHNKKKVLVLWPHVPSYLAACLKALLTQHNTEVFLLTAQSDPQANHVPLQQFGGFRYIDLSVPERPSEDELVRYIREFNPSIVVAGCGKWGLSARLARTAKSQGALAVLCLDHYWRGCWRDYANMCLSGLGLIYNFYDAAWVCGSLGRRYAANLGFKDARIFEGVYVCDTDLFRQVGLQRFRPEASGIWPGVFLFVGQYITRKNIDTLLRAYSAYRESVSAPWELWCAGQGPLKAELTGRKGVVDCGFQDAKGCAALMARSGALILPSYVDHWGVVIHEAACAGLPVLASRTCAAAVNLVRDGYNGFTFLPQDEKTLTMLMRTVSSGNTAQVMGQNSLRMSYQFDPGIWAETLACHIPEVLR